jgi:RNA polymerase sigma-70 factor (ECF subfamily)
VRAALDGDPAARERLIERLRCVPRFLTAQLRRRGRPAGGEGVEDLAQTVLLNLWQKLPEFAGRAALETWAYRFCTFTTMNSLRRERLRESASASVEDVDPGPEPAVFEPVDRGLLDAETAALLERLSPREAQIVRLRHFEDRDLAEIARALELSPSSVKTHYYRALEKLRAVLVERGGA